MIVSGILLLIVYIIIVIIIKINEHSEKEALNNFADTAIITRNQMRNYPPMVDIEGTIEEQRKRGI